MKQCLRCGEFKDESKFNKNKLKKDGLDIYCKTCCSELYRLKKDERSKNFRKYYEEHKQYYVNKANIWQKENSKRHGEINKLKNGRLSEYLISCKTPCVKCGEDRLYVIDFHHVDPKLKTCNLQSSRVGVDTINHELENVVCLCSNCHREFHHIYSTRPKTPVESLTTYLGVNPYDVVCRKRESEVNYGETRETKQIPLPL